MVINRGTTTYSRGAERTGVKAEATRTSIAIKVLEACIAYGVTQLRCMSLLKLREDNWHGVEWKTETIRAARPLA